MTGPKIEIRGVFGLRFSGTFSNLTKKPKPKQKRKKAVDECTIPPPMPVEELPDLVLPRNDNEVGKIAEYVEWQAKGGNRFAC